MHRLGIPTQAVECGAPVKAASLLMVFVLAKTAVLWRHSVSWWSWTLIAYVWQDVLVAFVFGVMEAALKRTAERSRLASLLYWTLAVYAVLNIPVGRVLSTPLTWPMLRATRGALADSILLYATWMNVAFVLLTLGAAAVLPNLLRRVPTQLRIPAVVVALVVVAIGPAARSRLDTIGLERNVVVALATSVLPRVDAQRAAADWAAPFEEHKTDDLSRLRGIVAGRNVVLVSLESTAAQYLRLYGGADDVTPRLDGLAQQAIVFENAYAVYPESIKGLFSVLCSTFPAFDTTPESYANAPCHSIAAILSQSGYQTALFHSGRFAYLGMESIVRNRGYDTLEDAGDIGGHHQSSFGVDEPSTVARILSWIDALPPGRRFFVTYLPIAGHHPYETPAPGPFPDREEFGRYRNALRYADESVGAFVSGLRARGLEQDTVWIVFGDHGEAFGQHEGNYGHTFSIYDENVRVPFMVAAPGVITRQQRSRTTVSLVDIAPTILDVLGIPSPTEYQGRSALDSDPRMALFFADYSLGLLGLRDGRWKFMYELESHRSKLFNLERDPGETIDLSKEHAERVWAYQGRLRAWSAAQKSYLAGVRAR
jgi:glucan phosphoethanolaminetransferase (alkaline phosphatase superfamily)